MLFVLPNPKSEKYVWVQVKEWIFHWPHVLRVSKNLAKVFVFVVVVSVSVSRKSIYYIFTDIQCLVGGVSEMFHLLKPLKNVRSSGIRLFSSRVICKKCLQPSPEHGRIQDPKSRIHPAHQTCKVSLLKNCQI